MKSRKIVGIVGWSGSGKTTIIENLVKIFKSKHLLSVCVLKHAHKNFTLDKKGKDSYKFSEAGADQIIISSEKQWAVINKVRNKEATLDELIAKTSNVDIVLVEGWKFSNIKKIEIYRQSISKNILCLDDKNIKAIASNDKNISVNSNISKLDINDHEKIANFIIKNKFE